MMMTSHLISYKNGKIFEIHVSILEILPVTLGIGFLTMFPLLLLLLPGKHCIEEIPVFHKKSYKLGRR